MASTATEVPKSAPKSVPSPRTGYALTQEDRRKGQLAQARKRSLAARSTLDVVIEKVEQEGERIVRAYLDAIDQGDWRAAEALQNRVYGTPVQRTASVVVDASDVVEVSLEDALRILGRDPASLHTTRTPSDRSVSTTVEGEVVGEEE